MTIVEHFQFHITEAVTHCEFMLFRGISLNLLFNREFNHNLNPIYSTALQATQHVAYPE